MAIRINGNTVAISQDELSTQIEVIKNQFQSKYITWEGEDNVLVTTVLNKLQQTASGKANIVVANEVPQTTTVNTQYWVKTYNGQTLQNGRYILITDSLNVVNYVGTSDVDLSDYVQDTRKVGTNPLSADITKTQLFNDIKDETGTFTNKTINADNNTVSNLETDNFKSGVIQTSVPATPTDTQILSAKAVNDAKQDKLSDDTDYTDNPADSDTLANTNLTTKKVKKISFANLWKWIGRKLTTTKPSSSSTNTQIPSAKAVWSGLEDRVLNSYSQVSVTQASTGEILFYKMGKIVIFSGWFYHNGSNDQLLCSSIPSCSSNNKFMATTGNGALRVYISGTKLRVENSGNAQYYSINGTYFTS